MTALLALSWGALTAAGVRSLAASRAARRRALPAVPSETAPTRPDRRGTPRAAHHDLPVAVELLRVAVSSGATPAEAVRAVAARCPPGAGALLARAVHDLDLGLPLADALARLSVAGPDGDALAGALVASAELGTPLEPALARLSADVRADLRRHAEARARTVPVRLLFPLVFLVLPAFLLLAVVPSVLAGAGA